jgi:hypothetical protein
MNLIIEYALRANSGIDVPLLGIIPHGGRDFDRAYPAWREKKVAYEPKIRMNSKCDLQKY